MALDTSQQAALSATLARRLPGFRALLAVDQLTAGASLETYRLKIDTDRGEARLAVRRTPGGGGKLSSLTPSIEAEARLIATARAYGVPEPEILFVLDEADGLGRGFVMEWIDGETLGSRIVRSESLAGIRPHLAYQCGEILGRIHSIDVAATGLEPLLHRQTPEEVVCHAIGKYDAFGTPRPMIDYAARWLLDHLPEPASPQLVHKDFRNGNLIVTPDGVAAVLDWEHAFLGDPMLDLGWLCCNSWRFGNSALPAGGFGSYADLFAGYTAASGQEVDPERVRYWELFASFAWAVGCFELAHQYRSGQECTVERLAIGRRVSECEIDCANLLLPNHPAGDDPEIPPTHYADARELVASVVDFLRDEVAAKADARLGYLAKVAANSLSIAGRELALGPAFAANELAGLERLLGHAGPIDDLRAELCRAIRSGAMPLDTAGLAEHLRVTVSNQLDIDQPRYSGRNPRRSDG